MGAVEVDLAEVPPEVAAPTSARRIQYLGGGMEAWTRWLWGGEGKGKGKGEGGRRGHGEVEIPANRLCSPSSALC